MDRVHLDRLQREFLEDTAPSVCLAHLYTEDLWKYKTKFNSFDEIFIKNTIDHFSEELVPFILYTSDAADY